MFSIDEKPESKTVVDTLNNYIGKTVSIKSSDDAFLYDIKLEEVNDDHLIVSNSDGYETIVMIRHIIHMGVS